MSSIRTTCTGRCLNEVQFPEELQRVPVDGPGEDGQASMKCSSRRNCSPAARSPHAIQWCLNEVQFPEELQLPVQYGPDLLASEEAPRALRPEDQGERSQGR